MSKCSWYTVAYIKWVFTADPISICSGTLTLFFFKGISPKGIELNDIFIGIASFLLMVFVAMFILYMVPGIVFWLPGVLYG